jgi:hypothetical protein
VVQPHITCSTPRSCRSTRSGGEQLQSPLDPTWEEIYRRAQATLALDLVPKAYGEAESGPACLARRLFRRTATAWQGPQREAAQRRLAEDEARAQELTRRAIKTLVRDLDLSVRDAGALLGLSHQRVQQLVQRQAGQIRNRVRAGLPHR